MRAGRRTTLAALGLVALLLAGVARPAPASMTSPAWRVVGGSTADPQPFAVALLAPPGAPYDTQFCGGTVVGPRHVVTAAHCVVDSVSGVVTAPHALRVLAGTAILRRPGGSPESGERTVGVTAVAPHPFYSRTRQDHDVAVLTVAETLTERPEPDVELESDRSFSGTVEVLGWGSTAPLAPGSSPAATSYPDRMQRADLTTVPDADCAAAYAPRLITITPRMVCTAAGTPTPCVGDSGGPLTHAGGGRRTLVGVVSFGIGCAQPQYPAVFARVADPAIRSFIESVVPPREPAPPTGDGPPATPPPPTGDGDAAPLDAEPPAPPPPGPPLDDPGPGTAPEPVVADEVPPAQRLARRRCEARRCVVSVDASDPAPSSGIRTVEVTHMWQTTRRCRRGPTRRMCTFMTIIPLPARHLGAGRYSVVAPRLLSRPSSLAFTAIDGDGNRAPSATTFGVPRRR